MSDNAAHRSRRWADYVAAVGVIVSIMFVGFELRQNTAAVRGATYQDLASTSADITLMLASDADFADAYFRWRQDPGSVTDVERMRVHTFVLGIGRNMENAFQQNRVGTLQGDLWFGYLGTWRSLAATSGFEDYWTEQRGRYSSEFQAYVDSAVLGR